ncbi:MAG: ABC transporter ATP-binding protein [Burkholderiales bacterium]|nr:ABC transporter ATP-binding protein [Burkholderiales bacterium]
MTYALQGESLRLSRGGKEILKGVSLEANQGKLVGLIGHNGAGKSTLIKIFLGLLKQDSGKAEVLGKVPGTNLLDIGYLPENISFYDGMTIEEHLNYFASLKRVDKKRTKELIDSLGIANVRKNKLKNCSKGQRQRLGLAQAILSHPQILFLDEPTVGLDPEATALMYKELVDLKNSGCSIVVCTHELSLLEDYVDMAIVLSQGEKKAQGTLDDLRKVAGLNTTITFNGNFYELSTHPALKGFAKENSLSVPEANLPDVIKVLAEDLKRYDMHIKEPGLLEVYGKLVGTQISPQQGVH